jgi:CspA family cold shock protein
MTETFHKGVLKTWKDDRGFGFIQPNADDKDVFVHISALKGMARRPVRGDIIYYEIGRDAGGKFKAVNARIEGVEVLKAPARAAKKWLLFVAIALGLVSAAVAAYAYLQTTAG